MITISIGGTNYSVIENSIQIQTAINQRSTASFNIYDATGTVFFTKGQQVTISETTLGTLFSGIIDSAQQTRLSPSNSIISSISCVDNNYFADKRIFASDDYTNMYAGDIACDMLSNYMATEGITQSYAIQNHHTQSQLATGTLSGTTSTTNVGDGDLELSSAGSTVQHIENTNSTLGAGTLTSLVTSNNTLFLNSRQALAINADCTGGFSNSYIYWVIWEGSYTIASGDSLIYTMWINGASPQIMAGVDGVCTDGTTIRDSNLSDQIGFGAHPNTILKGFADNQWYSRTIDISALSGKTLSSSTVSFEGDSAGHYAAYFYTIKIMNGSTTKLTIYSNNGNISENETAQVNGYYNFMLTFPTAYDGVGTRVSTNVSAAGAVIAKSSVLSYAATIPTGTTLEVDTSIDGGATWQNTTNHNAMPAVVPGMSLTGKNITTREIFTITGNDPIVTPVLSTLNWYVYSSYSATKSDVTYTKQTATDFNAGTVSNLSVASNLVTLNGVWRNWDNGSVSNQTIWGLTSPSQSVYQGGMKLSTGSNSEAHSQLNFAGNWQNFTMSVDIQIPNAGSQTIGVIYRTTNWANGNNSGAWVVDVSTTNLQLGYGSNSGTGNGTYTNVFNLGSAFFTPQAGSWHTIRIVTSGTNHQVFFDGVQYVNITNSTYNQSGGFALHANQTTGTTQSYFFDNFGVVQNLTGTYTSQNLSLNSVGTVGDSIICWQNDALPSTGTLLCQTSIDGGTTWLTATSGSPIPNLTPGQSVSGVNLKVRFTLTSTSAASTPDLNGYTVIVTSSFSSTGTRISPSLSLTPAGIAGSTSVSWNANLPSGCSLAVATSPDNITYTSIASSGSAIPNITTQPTPTNDTFTSNTSANYTQTDITGGTVSTWTWDTTNSRLTSSGGNGGLLINSAISMNDIDMFIDIDYSDNAGPVWRYTNQSNMYYLKIFDSSSNQGSTNKIQIWRVVSGTSTKIGSDIAVTLLRGNYIRIRVTMIGTTITVYVNGIVVSTQTDSSLTTGKCGVQNTSGSSHFYTLSLQPLGQSVSGQNVYTKVTLTSTNPVYTPQLLQIVTSVKSPSIQNGTLISQTNYKYQKTIAACFDDLAQQSDYWWNINYSKMFQFQLKSTSNAPWIAATINGDFLDDGNLIVTDQSPLYRNAQYVQGGIDTTSFTSTFMGDGTTQAWTLPYPLNSLPTITVNGLAMMVGIKGVDTGKDFYYAVGDPVIIQDPSEVPLTTLQTLSLTGIGQFDVVVYVNNPTEQTAYAALEGGSGIVEEIETLQSLNVAQLNKAQSTSIANSLLTYYETRGKTLTFTTLHSGLSVGQLLTVFLPELGLIDQQLLINQMTITALTKSDGTLAIFYAITAISGAEIGDWTQLFAALVS